MNLAKFVLHEIQRTYREIEKTAKDKAMSAQKSEEFLRARREASESHKNIERIRKIIQSK